MKKIQSAYPLITKSIFPFTLQFAEATYVRFQMYYEVCCALVICTMKGSEIETKWMRLLCHRTLIAINSRCSLIADVLLNYQHPIFVHSITPSICALWLKYLYIIPSSHSSFHFYSIILIFLTIMYTIQCRRKIINIYQSEINKNKLINNNKN